MKVSVSILAFFTIKNLKILQRACILNGAFLHRFSMCVLNFSILPITVPNSSHSLKLLILLTLVFMAKEVLCLYSGILIWNWQRLDLGEMTRKPIQYVFKIIFEILENIFYFFIKTVSYDLRNYKHLIQNIKERIINKYIKRKHPKDWTF